MFKCHNTVVAVLMPCLAMAGCHTNKQPSTVSEYRPGFVARERTAPESKVYVLAMLPDAARSKLIPATQAARNKSDGSKMQPVEVERVYAQQGSPLGFRESNGQLIAVAGATQKPLAEAHYTWHVVHLSRPGNPLMSPKLDGFLRTVAIITVTGVVVVGILWAIHDDRHSLLSDLFDSN